ncbi:MAG TPA: CGNR zinc finger domain-containing protein [Gemmatimonadales bacterium]|nr:CGNR zinc finger domain-containing protein [Gemmatimonadales bacterium]
MEFRFIAGSPALDFVNTVDWAGDSPVEGERLPDYATLLDWATTSGNIEKKLATKLAGLAKADPAAAARAHAAALRARAALRTVMRETAEDGKPSRSATEAFNRLLRSALAHAALNPQGTTRWSWEGAGEDLSSPLWPVLWSGAELLASPDASLIRECGAERCGWMYVDRSRPGNRKWCEMETCGNRAKARRHYHRAKSI